MLQRLFRGQSEAADAIGTATETLDAVIEDAQAQRDALQAQYDALQQQISGLWTQADAIALQMHELDQAIDEVGAEMDMGGGAVTVQISARDRSRRRAAGDDEIRAQLEELDRQKGEVISKMEAIEQKWGVSDSDELERKRDEIDNDHAGYLELESENDDLGEQIEALFDEASEGFDVGFLKNY